MDVLTIGIIAVADFFLISAGLYSAIKVVNAYTDHRDMFMYRQHMINAFVLLFILPVIVTLIGIKISSFTPQTGIIIPVTIERVESAQGRFTLDGKQVDLRVDTPAEVALQLINELDQSEEFKVDMVCISNTEICAQTTNIILTPPTKKLIATSRSLTLPILITLKKRVPAGSYQFNVTVRTQNNSVYDSGSMTIGVK